MLIRRGIAGGAGEIAVSVSSTVPTAVVAEKRRVKRLNREDLGRSEDGAWGDRDPPSWVDARPAPSSELVDPFEAFDPFDVFDIGRSRGSSDDEAERLLAAFPVVEGRRSGERIRTGVFGRTADFRVSINLYKFVVG